MAHPQPLVRGRAVAKTSAATEAVCATLFGFLPARLAVSMALMCLGCCLAHFMGTARWCTHGPALAAGAGHIHMQPA